MVTTRADEEINYQTFSTRELDDAIRAHAAGEIDADEALRRWKSYIASGSSISFMSRLITFFKLVKWQNNRIR